MWFSYFPVLPGSAEVQVIWGGILKHLLIAYFIGNISAKKISKSVRVWKKVIANRRWGIFWDTAYRRFFMFCYFSYWVKFVLLYLFENYFNYSHFYLGNLYMINFCVLLYQSSLWVQNVNKLLLQMQKNVTVHCGDNRLCQTSTLLLSCSITDRHVVPYHLKQAHNAIFCFRLYVYFVDSPKSVWLIGKDCGISKLLATAVHCQMYSF